MQEYTTHAAVQHTAACRHVAHSCMLLATCLHVFTCADRGNIGPRYVFAVLLRSIMPLLLLLQGTGTSKCVTYASDAWPSCSVKQSVFLTWSL